MFGFGQKSLEQQKEKSLKILVDDVNYWIVNNTFSKKEIAVRLHHRLGQIHPFPNGNGNFTFNGRFVYAEV